MLTWSDCFSDKQIQVSTMATLGGTPPRSAHVFRAKRTEARPRHTLFGTALENIHKSELEGIDASEASKIGVRQAPERYPIPEHLQGHVSGMVLSHGSLCPQQLSTAN